ncbi:MAG: L,D-transpeptidase [Bifidobacteriaceae bacterium]|jgi:lipoprotein-anchoring transpeptidase ErfK/SrfK|nr:L,D-transpeptidase [Bifidobacteriaceae bacterium]
MSLPDTREGRRPRRLAVAAAFALVAALAAWLAVGLTEVAKADDVPPSPRATATALAPGAAKDAPPAAPAEGPYRIAHLTGDVPAYAAPGGERTGTVAGSWWGYPSALPVIGQQDGYLLVRLQQRPNEATAWISAAGVETSLTPYRIVIDLVEHRLQWLESGAVIMDVPAIVGRPATPTPAGHFFVTMLYPGQSPGYGDLVLVLSAHSETIGNWQGSGDAIIAIHGPLGNEASVDLAGATSNGCVRIHLTDLDALAATVVPGTPVDILGG